MAGEGEVTGNKGQDGGITIPLDKNGLIPGTQYKSVDDLVRGHSSLKELTDRQGNELGTLRKQTGDLTEALKTVGAKKETPVANAEPDYDAQLADVEKQIRELDPVSDGYQKSLAELVRKSNTLAAASQHGKTLKAAGDLFKTELTQRDVQAAQQKFTEANPTFNTPEMQARIRERIATDPTGMHDPFSAFREIQRDDAMAKLAETSTKIADLEKRLNLANGTDSTGKVIVKGQSPGQSKTKTTKLTGKDLDAKMAEAIRAASDE